MSAIGQDTLKARRTLEVGGKHYDYFSLDAISDAGYGDISRLPFSLKVLLENLLRYEDGRSVSISDIEQAAKWVETQKSDLVPTGWRVFCCKILPVCLLWSTSLRCVTQCLR